MVVIMEITDTDIQPSKITYIEKVFPEIQKMIRQVSVNRFINISGIDALKVIDHKEPDAFIYGSNQTIILVSSIDARITFKSHFALKNITGIFKDNIKTTNKKKSYALDLFQEYANLTAGGIAQQLNHAEILCGISLPISTSGFDELISSDVLRSSQYHDYWQITGTNFLFTCTAMIEVFEYSRLDKFKFDSSSLNNTSPELEIF